MPGASDHEVTLLTFGRMAPDYSLYAGDREEVALREGCAMYSGQPMLIPKIRQILSGSAQTAAATFDINSTSQGFNRFFFANDEPKLWEWVPDPKDSALIDRTPTIATFEDLKHTFFKFGADYLAIPHSRGTAAVPLKYAVGDPRFEAMISAGTVVLGPHVGQVQSHLIIAGGWDSVNQQENNRFNWSARGNHGTWTAGTNEAGFAYITGEPEGNDIEDLVTWHDFAGIFTRTGIYRLGYQGGLEKWDLQHVGQAHQTVLQKSAVKAGRNAYYIGADGPRVLLDGSDSQPIARNTVARLLMDRTGSEWGVSEILAGFYDKTCGLVVWPYVAVDGNWRVAIYHLESDEFTLLNLGSPTTNKWGAVGSFGEWTSGAKISAGDLGITAFLDQTKPLGNTVIVPSASESSSTWRLWCQHLDDGASGVTHSTYPASVQSKIVRLGNPPGNESHEILEVRPLWRTNTAGEGLEVSLSIEYGDTPRLESTETGVASPLSLSTSNADEGGRVRAGLPGALGRFHRFTLNFPAISQSLAKGDPLSDYQKLEEFTGIEVVHRRRGR